MRGTTQPRVWPTVFLFLFTVASAPGAAQKPEKPPRPQRLDGEVELRRDSAGELRLTNKPPGAIKGKKGSGTNHPAKERTAESPTILRAHVNLVEVNCNVLRPDGVHVRGLGADSFRIFEDGVEQRIAHFDASQEPASLVLVLDSSPSVLPDLAEMKRAARALAARLSPVDEVAVVAFGSRTLLLLPFTADRGNLEKAIDSITLDLGQGSNIYEAVYLATRAVFRGRTGRKALILVTDGQDSGLGLSWSPSSALPQTGAGTDRLSFEDVARTLAEEGIALDAVSTQNRPPAMTPAWIEAHSGKTLLTEESRRLGIPHYTLYLAEMVRRAGGSLYFLHEIGTLAEVYERIAAELRAQYTLGYYPAGAGSGGWRALRVAVAIPGNATVRHRPAYYVPATP